MTNRTYMHILEELDWPPVYLISTEQFLHVEGDSIKGSDGIASVAQPIFTISKGLRGKVKANVIYHEIAHHLFPNRPHWWIECFSEKMARGGGRGYYSNKFGHTIDELPSRAYLLDLARKASKRLKEKL